MVQVGSLVDGKYKIIKEIGRGGMSVVWLAINERLNHTVAIKVIQKKEISRDIPPIYFFNMELRVLKSLNHHSLPKIYDVIDTEDEYMLVMTYIEGVTLQKLFQEQVSFPYEIIIDWAIQLCDVLSYLHSRSLPVIYRDMKPANVILQPNDRLVLIDFGIASTCQSDESVPMGTKGYAAPEQYGTLTRIDERTDIYALGVTLHQLLTGDNPTQSSDGLKPIRQYNPRLPDHLEWIIEKCTQKDPDKRFQSIYELTCALYKLDVRNPSYKRKRLFEFLHIWEREKISGRKKVVKGNSEEIESNIAGDLDTIYYNAELLAHLQSNYENIEIK